MSEGAPLGLNERSEEEDHGTDVYVRAMNCNADLLVNDCTRTQYSEISMHMAATGGEATDPSKHRVAVYPWHSCPRDMSGCGVRGLDLE